MTRFTLSGIGLGVFLILMGATYLMDRTGASARMFSSFLRFYPVLPILLGLDYLLSGLIKGKLFSPPEGWVTMLILLLTAFGLVVGIVPRVVPIPEGQWQDFFRGKFQPFTAEEEFSLQKEFALPDSVKIIRVENRIGEVVTETGASEIIEVTAIVTIRAPHEKDLAQYRQEYQLVGETQNQKFVLCIQEPGQGRPVVTTKLTVRIPVGYKVEIKNAFGAVRVTEVTSDLHIENNNGEVEVERVGGNAFIKNRFAAVRIGDVTGNLESDLSAGEFRVNRVGGDLDIKQGFGEARIGTVEGDVTINGKNGAVRVEQITGDVKLENSFGSVRLEDCRGAVNATVRNGNLEINASVFGGPYNLDVRFGGITVELPENATFNVDGTTSFGSIHSDFAVGSRREKTTDYLSGEVNGGGYPIRMEVRNGDIRLKKR